MKPLFSRRMLTLLLLLVAGAAYAGSTSVYKWVDEDGVTQFGDRPTSAAAEEVVVKTSEPASSSQASASDPKQKGEDSEACKSARKQLSEYQRAPFLYETDAQGKRHILPDEKRRELLDSVREEIVAVCPK